MSTIILANITWNPFGWRNNTYINPKAGHDYAKKNVGGEALNFNFNKKTVDTSKFIHGYVQWTNAPVSFDTGGLIIFFTRNTDENKGQIVGVYGKAERDFSILFPIPLIANDYKVSPTDRIVGQTGFAYKDENFAERILYDELIELSKAGTNETDFNKLVNIYEFYIGKKFKLPFVSNDEKEQTELEKFYRNKTKADILKELLNLKETDPEEIIVNRKTYKRDNKTIAQIKILRDFKCQICSTTIIKKDGSKYIEAAHVKAKHQKGSETLDNIVLLCPNHHKEFDFGHLEIKLHNTDVIDFLLNGRQYKIKLSIG